MDGNFQDARFLFAKQVVDFVPKDLLREIEGYQKETLNRLEVTNGKLLSVNSFSAKEFKEKYHKFKDHIDLLVATKRDLDNISKRIRILTEKIKTKYPASETPLKGILSSASFIIIINGALFIIAFHIEKAKLQALQQEEEENDLQATPSEPEPVYIYIRDTDG
eukprot:Sdes_comp20172_c0_seq8m13374